MTGFQHETAPGSPAAPAFLQRSAPRMGLTKADAAYAEIKARILACDLHPGAAIDQDMFANWLGSSTTPIREALRRLEAEQLVVLRAHSEVRVASASVEEFQELHTIRIGLEPLAAGIAAERATPEVMAHLEQYVAGVDPTASAAGGASPIGTREFHRAIYAAAGNATLTQILDGVWNRVSRYRAMLTEVGSHSSCDTPEHRAIVAAIGAHDSAEASRLLHDDITQAYEGLLPYLDEALQKFQ